MNNVLAIAGKEIYNYFVSPVAYIVTAVFIFINGAFFSLNLIAQQAKDLSNVAYIWAIMLMLVSPFLTMGLISDERRNGSMELLMTSAVRDWQITLGKFLGHYVFLLFMLVPTLFFVLLDNIYAHPEWPTLLTTYLALLLLGALISAIGLMVSSWTESQLIAAGVTFIMMIFLWLVSVFSQLAGVGRTADVIKYLGVLDHVNNMSQGIIDTKDIVYFVSLTALCIFIAGKSVEARRYSA